MSMSSSTTSHTSPIVAGIIAVFALSIAGIIFRYMFIRRMSKLNPFWCFFFYRISDYTLFLCIQEPLLMSIRVVSRPHCAKPFQHHDHRLLYLIHRLPIILTHPQTGIGPITTITGVSLHHHTHNLLSSPGALRVPRLLL